MRWPALSILVALLLGGCDGTSMSILTYEDLVKYPVSCERAEQQLAHLRYIQKVKNFDSDIEKLTPEDRAYNSRLKATIWWFAYRCEKY